LSEKIQYRYYREGDEEQIVKLLTTCFKDWPGINLEKSPLDHWYWKYSETKTIPQLVAIALHNHRVIGVNHSYLKHVKIFDELRLCRYGSDTAVHPDYRRSGVYNKLIEMNMEAAPTIGEDFSYWVTSNPILVEKYTETRPQLPHKVLNLVWVDDVDRQLEEMPMKHPRLVKTGVKGLKTIKEIGKTFTRETEAPPNEIIKIQEFDQRMEQFWNKVKQHYHWITVRDREYLNMRLCDPRAGRYHVYSSEYEDEIHGYLALFVNRLKANYPVGFITDLLTLPEKTGIALSLIQEALEFFHDNGVNIVNCQVTQGHPHEKALKKLGFIDTRIKLHLFYYSYMEYDPIQDLRNTKPGMIHFNYSDIDSMPTNPPKAQ
jgi:GNAT superfamily N-acetyltransferase